MAFKIALDHSEVSDISGEPIDVMYTVVRDTARRLPADRPRYLMGAGTPEDLVEEFEVVDAPGHRQQEIVETDRQADTVVRHVNSP